MNTYRLITCLSGKNRASVSKPKKDAALAFPMSRKTHRCLFNNLTVKKRGGPPLHKVRLLAAFYGGSKGHSGGSVRVSSVQSTRQLQLISCFPATFAVGDALAHVFLAGYQST